MTQHAELLPRYKHLRKVALKLNNRLVKTLPKSLLEEGGKKLGIFKNNTLILDSEDEIVVLMDYCLYDVRRQGANAVERYLRHSPPPPDSDEMILLQAMRQARYSLLAVEAVEAGVGVHLRDLLRDERLFLMDIGFSQTGSPGVILAGRVIAPEGIAMTTGAALPVGVIPAAKQAPFVQGMVRRFKGADFRNLSPEQASELAAIVIRTCLQSGAAEQIAYAEPGARISRGRVRAGPPPARQVGRNEPCPCGSGRKFKHCCGARH